VKPDTSVNNVAFVSVGTLKRQKVWARVRKVRLEGRKGNHKYFSVHMCFMSYSLFRQSCLPLLLQPTVRQKLYLQKSRVGECGTEDTAFFFLHSAPGSAHTSQYYESLVRRESTSLSHPKVLGKMRHVTLFIRNIEMGDHCGLNLTAYHRFVRDKSG
jgi:hypothetical protein